MIQHAPKSLSMKNDTTDFEDFDLNDICYFGYFCIVISIRASKPKRARLDMFLH